MKTKALGVLMLELLLMSGLSYATVGLGTKFSTIVLEKLEPVTISTPAAGLTFGTVDLNTSYVNSSTATVKNTGNVSADWKIKGIKLDTWDLGSAPGADTVRLLGVFKTSLASSGDFDVSLDTITATEANMNSTNYSVDANGDNVAVNGTRLLSIRLDTPTDSSVDVEQRFRVEIKAYASSTF